MACYSSDGYYTAGICQAINAYLSDYVSQGNLPSAKRTKTGFLDAIMSPMNSTDSISMFSLNGGEGANASKKRTVRVQYHTRATESIVSTSSDTITDCTTDYFDDLKEVDVEAEYSVHAKWGIKADAVKDICYGDMSQMQNIFLFNKLDALVTAINRQLITVQSTNFGINYGNSPASTAAKTVTVLKADGSPYTGGLQTIIQDYEENNEYVGTPMIIGNGNIGKHLKAIASGCCNDAGVDLARMLQISDLAGASYFNDTQALTSVLGAERFIVMAPGTTKFVGWNRYKGDAVRLNGETSSVYTIIDPISGIEFDFKVTYDVCTEEYVFQLYKNFNLFNIPADAWCDDDVRKGTNGTALYVGAQAVS